MWDVVWTIAGAIGFAYVFEVGEKLARRVAGPPELSAATDKGDIEDTACRARAQFRQDARVFLSAWSL
jgi:hypothetical protein